MKLNRIKAILCVLAAAMLLSACALFQINPERDGARVVATVGDREITKKQVYDAMGIDWDYSVDSWDEESLQTSKEDALNDLVSTELLIAKAEELNLYDFTDEDWQAIEEKYQEYTGDVYADALAQKEEAALEDDSIDPAAEAQKAVEQYLAIYGYTEETFRSDLADSQAMEKLNDYVNEGITITDEEIQTEYDTLVYNQATSYTTGTSVISAYNSGTPIVVYPVEMHRVKHILISFDTTDKNSITEARNESDEDADALRLNLAQEKLLTEAQEVLDKLEEGEDFTALMEEYTDDTGSATLTEGYLVSADYEGYVPEFSTASLALTEEGSHSGLVLTDHGYHIIQLEEIIPAGTRALDVVRDAIKARVQTTLETERWNEALTQWEQEYGIKTYPKRLK